MPVTQLSVFVENKRGRVAEVIGALALQDIPVYGLSLAEVSDYGVVRLLAEDGPRAHEVLEGAGFTTVANPVISVALPDQTEALARVVRLVADCGANIEYMYLTSRPSVVLRVDDEARVEGVLRSHGFSVREEAVD
jgi:hypothetical protein